MKKVLLMAIILIGLSVSCFADDTAPSRSKMMYKHTFWGKVKEVWVVWYASYP